jgi:hypothetical protein
MPEATQIETGKPLPELRACDRMRHARGENCPSESMQDDESTKAMTESGETGKTPIDSAVAARAARWTAAMNENPMQEFLTDCVCRVVMCGSLVVVLLVLYAVVGFVR